MCSREELLLLPINSLFGRMVLGLICCGVMWVAGCRANLCHTYHDAHQV